MAVVYRKQNDPLWLSMNSFLTRTHNAFRLRSMLKDGGDDAVYAFLTDLAKATGTREQRKALAESIRDGKQNDLLKEAARDLLASLPEIPDSSLAADWSDLCNEMVRDLKTGPRRTLETLEGVRQTVARAGGARFFLISSSAPARRLTPACKVSPLRLRPAL